MERSLREWRTRGPQVSSESEEDSEWFGDGTRCGDDDQVGLQGNQRGVYNGVL